MTPFSVMRGFCRGAFVATALIPFSGWSQTAPADPASPLTPVPSKTETRSTAEKSGDRPEEDVVRLSPFQVNEANTRGYFASSTLSGTRLNTDLADLGASITVVTKQQLLDTASIDINDVFRYEANTEGMFQYTEFTQDRTFYNETTTLSPQSANRVRGIGVANSARDNFAASKSIPMDAYNTESLEISRGPNANIFGLGEAAGTVNWNVIKANPAREINQIRFQVDSYGGSRATLDLNRPLVKDTLAIRVAGLHEEKGFERQPSYEKIDRWTAAVTARPFKNTTVYGWAEHIEDRYNRANTTLPRDSISEWMNNGMPVWNPNFGTTGGWRPLNGTTYTAVTAANEANQFPLGLSPGASGFFSTPSAYIDNGQIQRLEMNRFSDSATAPNGNGTRRYEESGDIIRRSGNVLGYPPLILYQPLSIANKAQYDYTSTNFLPNTGHFKGDVMMAELEQRILDTQHHFLALQLGFMQEVVNTTDRNFFSQSDTATPYVSVDVNEFLLDGSPNPYFLRPYLGASAPLTHVAKEKNNNFRGTLAYQLDFRKDAGWTKWLGFHRFTAYGEYRHTWNTGLGARDRDVSDYSWTSGNDKLSLPIRSGVYNLYTRYYLGGPITDPGAVIDHAPTTIPISSSVPLTWYNNAGLKMTEPALIDSVIVSGNTKERELRTEGLVWQGYLWNDRIIPTFGWRSDRPRDRQSRNLNSNPTQSNTTIDPATREHDLKWVYVFPDTTPWIELPGKTKTHGVVVKPFSWLSFSYNEADSFLPADIAYDIWGHPLPNPSGKGNDYAVTFNLLKNKLTLKLNHYKTVQNNSRSGAITSAFPVRIIRLFFDPAHPLTWDATNRRYNNDSDDFDLEQRAATVLLAQNPNWTPDQAQQAAVSQFLAPLGMDQAFIDRIREIGTNNFAEVNTVTSKGNELEVNYNPNDYWTVKVTGAQQQAVDTDLSTHVLDFLAQNLAPAQAIVLSGGTVPWWKTSASTNLNNTPENFYFVNVLTTLTQASANVGRPRPQTREYRAALLTNYRLAGLTENRWLKNLSIGGAVRWESRSVVGYYGAAPDPLYKNAIINIDPSRPIYDPARAYVDFKASYGFKILNGRSRCTIQLNVQNAFENGRLQPFVFNPDGTAWNYRIIDPRKFILSTTFDL